MQPLPMMSVLDELEECLKHAARARTRTFPEVVAQNGFCWAENFDEKYVMPTKAQILELTHSDEQIAPKQPRRVESLPPTQEPVVEVRQGIADSEQQVAEDPCEPPRNVRWDQTAEIELFQQAFIPQAGDVFVVTNFPLRGLFRLLVALVEDGNRSPWDPNLVSKPHVCLSKAQSMGTAAYNQEVSAWPGRRIFQAVGPPSKFPCRLPFRSGVGTSPKVMVLLSDPRHTIAAFWSFCRLLKVGNTKFKAFVEAFIQGELSALNRDSLFADSLAWARMAAQYPGQVRLFRADCLGSVHPQEVLAELSAMADFLEIPQSKADVLTASLFSRPAGAELSLQFDEYPVDTVRKGPLVEQASHNIVIFEEALNSMPVEESEQWKRQAMIWINSEVGDLIRLGIVATKGGASTPAKALTGPMEGIEVHLAGQCRPCIFATKGTCTQGSLCSFCHEEHGKKQRLNKQRRRAKANLRRVRTPSPEGDRSAAY